MKSISIEAVPAIWPNAIPATTSDTALLIIDMQRDFCDPSGYVATMGYDITPIRRIVPRIAAIREWGGLVIYSREGHRPDLADLNGLKRERSRRGSYGPAVIENNSHAAIYVDRILKGAKIADLPFEEPIKYVLAINFKTAKALGITVPPKLLALADEVIE